MALKRRHHCGQTEGSRVQGPAKPSPAPRERTWTSSTFHWARVTGHGPEIPGATAPRSRWACRSLAVTRRRPTVRTLARPYRARVASDASGGADTSTTMTITHRVASAVVNGRRACRAPSKRSRRAHFVRRQRGASTLGRTNWRAVSTFYFTHIGSGTHRIRRP